MVAIVIGIILVAVAIWVAVLYILAWLMAPRCPKCKTICLFDSNNAPAPNYCAQCNQHWKSAECV